TASRSACAFSAEKRRPPPDARPLGVRPVRVRPHRRRAGRLLAPSRAPGEGAGPHMSRNAKFVAGGVVILGELDARGLLQGHADHGQALRGVQGAPRAGRGGLSRADQDPEGRAMIPEVGQGATVVALLLALGGAVAAAAGRRTGPGRGALVEAAQRAAVGVFALVTFCFALLTYAFLTFDFSVRYVASNTTLGTPFSSRITGLWGALGACF